MIPQLLKQYCCGFRVPMSKDVTCHPSQSQFRHLGSVVPDLAHYGLDVILCCPDVRSHGACAILRHPVTIPASNVRNKHQTWIFNIYHFFQVISCAKIGDTNKCQESQIKHKSSSES